MQLQLKRLFAIDTFSLILFTMSILGILYRFPTAASVCIQSIFVGLTLLLTANFMRRRAFGMVALKLSMLFALYSINAMAYLP